MPIYLSGISGAGAGGAGFGYSDLGNSGSATTLTFSSTVKSLRLVLSANCSLTLAGASPGDFGIISLVQGAAAPFTVTWLNAKWPGNVTPTLTTTPYQADDFLWYYNGTDYRLRSWLNYTASDAPFANAKSLTLDGISKYVDMGTAFQYAKSTPFTISMWFKQAANGTSALYSSVAVEMYCLSGQGLELQFNRTAAVSFDSAASQYSLNTWNHIAGSHDGSGTDAGAKLWINGSLVTTTRTGTWPASFATSVLKLGGTYTTGNYFNGKIDEVSWWNKQLSTAEVQAIYNSGHPTNLSQHSAALNLVSWLRCGDLDDSASQIKDRVGANNGTPTNIVAGDFSTDRPV